LYDEKRVKFEDAVEIFMQNLTDELKIISSLECLLQNFMRKASG